jgi:Lrp/AsnC family transcriptional regulator, leucine-responsive regulatory protein
MKLDDLDRNLLKNLQLDARLSLRDLGRMLDVPHTTVFTRVNKLIDKGIIKNFSAVLHPHELGFKQKLLVIDSPEGESKAIAQSIATCEEVMRVYRTNDGKVLVKAISKDDSPGCLDAIISKTNNHKVIVYAIDDVVKYDNKVGDGFIELLE